jgi:chromosome segregation ATPase
MSDPSVEVLERFREAVDRLKTEQAKDFREIVQRIAALETLPDSIDLLRQEFREFQKELREIERDRDKHPPKADSGSRTNIRVAKINSLPLILTAVSGLVLGLLGLLVQLFRGG